MFHRKDLLKVRWCFGLQLNNLELGPNLKELILTDFTYNYNLEQDYFFNNPTFKIGDSIKYISSDILNPITEINYELYNTDIESIEKYIPNEYLIYNIPKLLQLFEG